MAYQTQLVFYCTDTFATHQLHDAKHSPVKLPIVFKNYHGVRKLSLKNTCSTIHRKTWIYKSVLQDTNGENRDMIFQSDDIEEEMNVDVFFISS